MVIYIRKICRTFSLVPKMGVTIRKRMVSWLVFFENFFIFLIIKHIQLRTQLRHLTEFPIKHDCAPFSCKNIQLLTTVTYEFLKNIILTQLIILRYFRVITGTLDIYRKFQTCGIQSNNLVIFRSSSPLDKLEFLLHFHNPYK